jgi:hypothetical protein
MGTLPCQPEPPASNKHAHPPWALPSQRFDLALRYEVVSFQHAASFSERCNMQRVLPAPWQVDTETAIMSVLAAGCDLDDPKESAEVLLTAMPQHVWPLRKPAAPIAAGQGVHRGTEAPHGLSGPVATRPPFDAGGTICAASVCALGASQRRSKQLHAARSTDQCVGQGASGVPVGGLQGEVPVGGLQGV